MRKLFSACLIVLFLQGSVWAQAPRLYERSLKRSSDNKYLVYVPQNYDRQKKYPLFIAIHSRGGPAKDQYNQWNNFTNREKFILLCPQHFGGYQRFTSDEDRKLLAMMREVKSEFKYDSNKVYLAGFSTGADFVQNFAFKHPSSISAAVILAARNYQEPPYSGKARGINYFLAVGERDELSFEPTRQFYQQMQNKGYTVRYRQFPVGKRLTDEMKNAAMVFLRTL